MIISDELLLNDLNQKLIPFWRMLRDDENGGFYGFVSNELETDRRAEKGCILNSRILWFFSRAYSLLGDKSLLSDAQHAYEFLVSHFLDKENGGVFWSSNAAGDILDGSKHTYNQAFAVYALSAYYDASGCEKALSHAVELFDAIEKRCFDGSGYLEQFDAEWNLAGNDKLSENGVIAQRTMNTMLHVLEAYTGLYSACRNSPFSDKLPEIGARLGWMIDEMITKVYNPERKRMEVFFDLDMNSILDLHSYGHDIEGAWLLDKACDALGDSGLTERERKVSEAIEDSILDLLTDHGLPNECENGTVDEWRVWWVQAESVVGFANALQKRPWREDFRQAVISQWEYIHNYIEDRRCGEWFWRVDEKGKPDARPMVEPWKCPYHNGRMYIEMLNRKEASK